MDQARGGDRPVVGVGAKHDQGSVGPEPGPERVADVEQLAVRPAHADRLQQILKGRLPVGATRGHRRAIHERGAPGFGESARGDNRGQGRGPRSRPETGS